MPACKQKNSLLLILLCQMAHYLLNLFTDHLMINMYVFYNFFWRILTVRDSKLYENVKNVINSANIKN